MSANASWHDGVPNNCLRQACISMGYKPERWNREQMIQGCNLIKDAGSVTDDLMRAVCLKAEQIPVRDSLKMAIWACNTPQPTTEGPYDAKVETCYYNNTCPSGSRFTREANDAEGAKLYCCDDDAPTIEVTAEVFLNASGTPTQEQFADIIDASKASRDDKAKEKARYNDEMTTLMGMLKTMEAKGDLKNNEAYQLLLAMQQVKREFSDRINKLSEDITQYFGGKDEGEAVKVMEEAIKKKGFGTRVFNIVWENVKWMAATVGAFIFKSVSALTRHYVYMLVYHPATLRFFIYTALELKAEFCARFGMIRRIPRQTVWEKLRAIPASTLKSLSSGAAWTLASVQVFLEQTMAFQHLEGMIAFIMDPVYNLAVLPAISVVFGASASATAVIYGILQYGGKIAGKAFGRVLEAQMWKYNIVTSLAETQSWFFDWSQCVRDVETDDEIPVRCPHAPNLMCYKAEIEQYKLGTGTVTDDRGAAYVIQEPNTAFQRPKRRAEESDQEEFYDAQQGPYTRTIPVGMDPDLRPVDVGTLYPPTRPFEPPSKRRATPRKSKQSSPAIVDFSNRTPAPPLPKRPFVRNPDDSSDSDFDV